MVNIVLLTLDSSCVYSPPLHLLVLTGAYASYQLYVPTVDAKRKQIKVSLSCTNDVGDESSRILHAFQFDAFYTFLLLLIRLNITIFIFNGHSKLSN